MGCIKSKERREADSDEIHPHNKIADVQEKRILTVKQQIVAEVLAPLAALDYEVEINELVSGDDDESIGLNQEPSEIFNIRRLCTMGINELDSGDDDESIGLNQEPSQIFNIRRLYTIMEEETPVTSPENV